MVANISVIINNIHNFIANITITLLLFIILHIYMFVIKKNKKGFNCSSCIPIKQLYIYTLSTVMYNDDFKVVVATVVNKIVF